MVRYVVMGKKMSRIADSEGTNDCSKQSEIQWRRF